MVLKYSLFMALFLCSFITAINEHLERLMRESQNVCAMDFSQEELNLFLSELDRVQLRTAKFIVKLSGPTGRSYMRLIGQLGDQLSFGVSDVENVLGKLRELVTTGQIIKLYIDGTCEYVDRDELAQFLDDYDQKMNEIIRLLDRLMPGRSVRNVNDVLHVFTIFFNLLNKSFSAKPTVFLVCVMGLLWL